MADRINRARELRAMIEHNAQGMAPAQMPEFPELFPEWSGDGKEYPVGKVVRYGGEFYKAILAHRSQPDWTPETAPSLFAKVLTDPAGAILPWVQPDSTNGYQLGDKVTHNGKTWENTLADMANVWEPGVFGWTEIA